MPEPGRHKNRTTLWVLIAAGAVALALILYLSFNAGVFDQAVENDNGIEPREDVEAVVIPESADVPSSEADGDAPPIEPDQSE